MSEAEVTVVTVTAAERDELLLSIGTTFAVQEQAMVDFASCPWTDEEIAVLHTLPAVIRMETAARLIELSDLVREAIRQLDGRILQLTDQQTSTPAA